MVFLPFWGLPVLPLLANAANLLKVPISSTLQFVNGSNGASQLGSRSVFTPNQNQILKVVASVRCGNNQTFNQVLVDTGSAILWVGGRQQYEMGPNTEVINQTFSVGYGIGSAEGPAYIDTVTIGGAIATNQIIGAASNVSGMDLVKPIDGILGLGTSQSNTGEVSGYNTTPTFVETLVADGSIDAPVFGLYVAPLSNTEGLPAGTGEISFGGPDPDRYKGIISWLPQLQPYNFRWEFNVSGLYFGNVTMNSTAFGRTDSGVLGIELPTDQYINISHAYNATIISSGPLLGYLSFPSNSRLILPLLKIKLGHTVFTLPPSQYLISNTLYPSLNLTDNALHSWIAPGGFETFNLGQKALEKIYTVYDMANHRVGFAHLA
ncbi:hypothetical protein M422DRAFT_66532 [Sphaerobolus stellatus SS14]|nr:hypothetical protein M422DRAFT_66532 [Sphaerobolus stellatus SS14]